MKQYYREEPWGTWRENLHFAHLMALLANINRSKGSAPYNAESFMLYDSFGKKQAEKQKLVQFFKTMGTKVKKRKRKKRTK